MTGTGADETRLDQPIDACWRRIGVSGDRSCPKLAEHLHCRNCPVHEAAARRLLDRPLPAEYREEWARHYANPETGGSGTGDAEDALQTVVVFRLGDEWLALPTAIFEEIAEPRPIRSLPHRRNKAILGIVNVRGELIVCASLAALIGIDEQGATERSARANGFRRLVVIGHDQGRMAFIVDEVHGILRHRRSELRPVPATIGKTPSAFSIAALPWKDQTVGCLDEARLLAAFDRSLA
ncbi:chemotaxis protein CheW [Kaistia dalseonensis]|uniref:Chemotaxis protein CheW n=1 Tax=Kaistia dalseonensis TaxID=410840 RepID=A0ABU0H2Y0_9HYPH|nr:chemotaxis protein CheW [Kaistia dalseonensis]MCX5493297.1 chemotaxis protein CheW [Kaistia dalseonensis]MDQ0435854.1 chemotaxis-related protein WspD [Kaistia dalseonensis]